ncbi:MAG: P-type DNA transfer ATPase VirB11 [Steroidobacteraceae bacterium]
MLPSSHNVAFAATNQVSLGASSSPQSETSALGLTLRILDGFLCDPKVTELCVNRPGEVFVETTDGWRRESIPELTFDWCLRFARLAANFTGQRIDACSPLLSGALPAGERVQIVLPPATTAKTVAITIRRPSTQQWSIEELAQAGIFKRARRTGQINDDTKAKLLELLAERQFEAFMRLAVTARKNILVSGPTGSGKTTWTKALIREIPSYERLITIEDARELVLDQHPNHVRLFYSKDDQGLSRVTPKQLLESCLRMKPDRILLAELRAEEAYDYLRNVNSGHPGSITSVHASSAELAFEQLMLLVKQSPAGREMARREILSLLYLLIDVVIQFSSWRHERFIEEIWYEPELKHRHLEALE